MGGFFGVASKKDCVLELFYGVDYHSHLGTRRGGMAAYGNGEFCRAIHNIENAPFRTKFDRDVDEMKGNLGIGCISDYEPQPLLIQSHHGSFAIVTVGKINNEEELLEKVFEEGHSHFQEMSGGKINATELVASLICKKETLVEGIRYAQETVNGSLTLLLMTKDGIYAARDRYGRTPVVVGKKEEAYCVSFENSAYINLGYEAYKELGPGEIDLITPESVEQLVAPGKEMKICSFLWVYYGYPTSSYEGVNVEEMRYKCGSMLAKRDGDSVHPDIVAGVPDSGIAHAIGKRENGCENRDFGFRVLRLDESNMEDVYYMPEEYTQEMLCGLETNIKPDRTDLDLLFACLTEWGLLLSKPYSSEKIGGYTVHYYDGKELAACFNENISETVIRKIAGQHPRRAVFCDASFSDSAAKINMSELFRTISPETQIKVI